jgi:hypothetical protein
MKLHSVRFKCFHVLLYSDYLKINNSSFVIKIFKDKYFLNHHQFVKLMIELFTYFLRNYFRIMFFCTLTVYYFKLILI